MFHVTRQMLVLSYWAPHGARLLYSGFRDLNPIPFLAEGNRGHCLQNDACLSLRSAYKHEENQLFTWEDNDKEEWLKN